MTHQDTPRSAYLRHRPFLLIEVFLAPVRGVRTERKGWMADGQNTISDEVPNVVQRVSDKHLCKAAVIIDLVNHRVVKNNLSDSDAATLSRYTRKYSHLIDQEKSRWGVQRA